MAISKNLSLSRPLDLPKPAPTAKPAATKPAQIQGGIAGQAEAPHKPATKPQGQLSRPSVDSFNPNTKPKPDDRPIVGINPNAPNGGVIIPGGDKGAYDLGAAFDRAFDQGVILDATTGGAELRPGGGWGDLIEANKDSIPPGWANNE